MKQIPSKKSIFAVPELTLNLVCEGRADSNVSLDGDGDCQEDAGSDGDVRDTVRVGDERVHHTDQLGVKVLKRHCHGADDDKDVRSAEEHHQVVENIAHRSRRF